MACGWQVSILSEKCGWGGIATISATTSSGSAVHGKLVGFEGVQCGSGLSLGSTPSEQPLRQPRFKKEFFMFKQLNRWLIAWPASGFIVRSGAVEKKNTRDRNPLAQVKSSPAP